MAQTTAAAFNKRWDFIQTLWQDNRWLFVFAGWMFGLLTFPLLQLIDTNWRGLLYNLVPEAVGITFTVLILNRLADNRARLELQKRLVREAGSLSSNETAKAAVDWLRAEGWLTTKNSLALLKAANLRRAKLQGADLHEANLEGANLGAVNLEKAGLLHANLQGADLLQAKLQGANLWQANLETADLRYANLQAANLGATNLQAADLRYANLQAADLQYANLQAVDLRETNLQQADLWNANLCETTNIKRARFDEKTVLPDAIPLADEKGKELKDKNGNTIYDKYWTPETDMTRYTNPEHPDFWQPEYTKPGYDGWNKPWWAKKQAEE